MGDIVNPFAQKGEQGFHEYENGTEAVTLDYLANYLQDRTQYPRVFGVAVHPYGTRDSNGARLVWIDEDFNIIPDLPPDFFDWHPSFQFTRMMDEFGNEFIRIPVAWWKRGTVPSGKGQNSGQWYMMISPEPKEGFEPNRPAFMYAGKLTDAFYYGKWRGTVASSKARSVPTNWVGTGHSWQSVFQYCRNVGPGYHMTTVQEYHEILARLALEKKTFNPYPESVRRTDGVTDYRGILNLAYHQSSTWAEWFDGLNKWYEYLYVYDNEGNRTLKYTGQGATHLRTSNTASNGYPRGLLSGQYFNGMFLQNDYVSISSSLIPDSQTRTSGNPTYYTNVSYDANYTNFGPFNVLFDSTEGTSMTAIGFRLCYSGDFFEERPRPVWEAKTAGIYHIPIPEWAKGMRVTATAAGGGGGGGGGSRGWQADSDGGGGGGGGAGAYTDKQQIALPEDCKGLIVTVGLGGPGGKTAYESTSNYYTTFPHIGHDGEPTTIKTVARDGTTSTLISLLGGKGGECGGNISNRGGYGGYNGGTSTRSSGDGGRMSGGGGGGGGGGGAGGGSGGSGGGSGTSGTSGSLLASQNPSTADPQSKLLTRGNAEAGMRGGGSSYSAAGYGGGASPYVGGGGGGGGGSDDGGGRENGWGGRGSDGYVYIEFLPDLPSEPID